MAIKLTSITSYNELPQIDGNSIFHSNELFKVFEQTKGYKPIMIVAKDGDKYVARLMGTIRRSVRFFPPSIIKRCEVYGSGEYFDNSYDKEEIFAMLLEELTQQAKKRSFLIEFRNLENPLLGYNAFKKNNYFAINWLRVYNSLHSKSPEERVSSSKRRQLIRAIRSGVKIEITQNEEDIKTFSKMLKNNYSSKIRKHFPHIDLFIQLSRKNSEQEISKIFLVKYNNKIIGGSVCLFSKDTAYLWFSMGLRKSYPFLYPGIMAVWGPLKWADENGYQHFEFLDPGLPFKKYGYREFILSFGGKQTSTRRWFRFRWNILNKVLCKLYS